MPDESRDPKDPGPPTKADPKADLRSGPARSDPKSEPKPEPKSAGAAPGPTADESSPEGEAPAAEDRTRSLTIGDPGQADRSPGRPAPSQLPGERQLEAARTKRFGDRPGTVRIEAPARNADADAGPAKFVFFDEAGRKVGEEDYVPETEV